MLQSYLTRIKLNHLPLPTVDSSRDDLDNCALVHGGLNLCSAMTGI